MDKYRKQDNITDQEIELFEQVEINRIKSNFPERKVRVIKRPVVAGLVSIFLLIAIIVIGNQPRGGIITPGNKVLMAEFSPITLADLPRPLQGINYSEVQNMSNTSTGAIQTMAFNPNNSLKYGVTKMADFDMFEDEVDVTGEGLHNLTELIEDQDFYNMAISIFEEVNLVTEYLVKDTPSVTDDGIEYYYTVNEDGTSAITTRTTYSDRVEVLQVESYYIEDELFYEVAIEVIIGDLSDVFKIVYNEDNTEKYQYGKVRATGEAAEMYISVVKNGEFTDVVAMYSTNDESVEVVGNATDDYGVIFSSITYDDDSKEASTEFYNDEGVLLKQEYGFKDLTVFDEALTLMYEEFEANEEINLVNLSDTLDGFDEPDTFTVEISIYDIDNAMTQRVDASLVTESKEYDIQYTYMDLMYTKKEIQFVSGDTLYYLTFSEIDGETVLLTYSALYQVPFAITGPDSVEYYVMNRYMAKYIEPKEGFEISLESEGHYHLTNLDRVGELGDHIDIEIEEAEYFKDDELVKVKVFQHTSDIQIENLIFTEMDVIAQAKANFGSLYEDAVPTYEELEEHYQSLDVSNLTS